MLGPNAQSPVVPKGWFLEVQDGARVSSIGLSEAISTHHQSSGPEITWSLRSGRDGLKRWVRTDSVNKHRPTVVAKNDPATRPVVMSCV